ncbi:MAG: SMC-Scp complex subunit ScpB [Planctomycetaceae bacterium]|jgi:segregation and condensation protein B|nr:SMC-Scp complex subunit ScpB [Planctomycetaceae bacterium]
MTTNEHDPDSTPPEKFSLWADDFDESNGTDETLSLDSFRKAFAGFEDEIDEDTDKNVDINVDNGREDSETVKLKIAATDNEVNDEYEADELDGNNNSFTDTKTAEANEAEYITDDQQFDDDTKDAVELSPRSIFEAMLFVGDRDNRPLTSQRAAELMRNVSPNELDNIVTELNNDYTAAGRPYRIVTENDGYRMTLRDEYNSVRDKFYGKIREAKLSQQAIDILAIVAYRQPITAEEVQTLRKSPSAAILSQLVKRGLLETERRVEAKKQVTFYRTTNRFLQLFGLKSTDDLPTTEELGF